MNIYKDIVPQPEIRISHNIGEFWSVECLPSGIDGIGIIRAPHKIGESVPCKYCKGKLRRKVTFYKKPCWCDKCTDGKMKVKSIDHRIKDGKWQWKIEVVKK